MRPSGLTLVTVLVVALNAILFGHGFLRLTEPPVRAQLPYFDLGNNQPRRPDLRTFAPMMLQVKGVGGFGGLVRVPGNQAAIPGAVALGLLALVLLAQLGVLVRRLVSPTEQRKALLGKVARLAEKRKWLQLVEIARRGETRFAGQFEEQELVRLKLAIGQALTGLGKHPLALAEYQQVLGLVPTSFEALAGAARTMVNSGGPVPDEWLEPCLSYLRRQNPTEMAEVVFFAMDLVKRCNNDRKSLDAIANYLAPFRSRDDLIEQFQHVLASRGEQPDEDGIKSDLVLARFHLHRKEPGSALDPLRRALKRDSDRDIVHELLWNAFQDIGDLKQLNEFYRALGTELRDSPATKRALDKLRRTLGPDYREVGTPKPEHKPVPPPLLQPPPPPADLRGPDSSVLPPPPPAPAPVTLTDLKQAVVAAAARSPAPFKDPTPSRPRLRGLPTAQNAEISVNRLLLATPPAEDKSSEAIDALLSPPSAATAPSASLDDLLSGVQTPATAPTASVDDLLSGTSRPEATAATAAQIDEILGLARPTPRAVVPAPASLGSNHHGVDVNAATTLTPPPPHAAVTADLETLAPSDPVTADMATLAPSAPAAPARPPAAPAVTADMATLPPSAPGADRARPVGNPAPSALAATLPPTRAPQPAVPANAPARTAPASLAATVPPAKPSAPVARPPAGAATAASPTAPARPPAPNAGAASPSAPIARPAASPSGAIPAPGAPTAPPAPGAPGPLAPARPSAPVARPAASPSGAIAAPPAPVGPAVAGAARPSVPVARPAAPPVAATAAPSAPPAASAAAPAAAAPAKAGPKPTLDSALTLLATGDPRAAIARLQEVRRAESAPPGRVAIFLAAGFLALKQPEVARVEIDRLGPLQVRDDDLYMLATKCEAHGLTDVALGLYRRLYAQNMTFLDTQKRMEALDRILNPRPAEPEAPPPAPPAAVKSPETSLTGKADALSAWIPKRYAEPQLVGRGGMGAVFRARATELDRVVAIKLLSPHLSGSEESEQRFLTEARTLANLKHPGLIEIYDINRDNVPYIAMEFLEGQNMGDMLRARTLTLGKALKVLAQVVVTLGHCHKMGVLHRDVKPENIVVGPTGAVKLVDFGLARRGAPGATQPGLSIGSPLYMAPEQLKGGEVDQRADLYAIGVCLYYVCTGRHPFRDEAEHLGGTCKPIRQLNPQLPAALEAVVSKCLARNPAERYASAEALSAELAPFVKAPAPKA